MGGCNSKPSSPGAVVTTASSAAPEHQRRLPETGDASRPGPSSSAVEAPSPIPAPRQPEIDARPAEPQHESPIEHDADEQSQEWNDLFTSLSAHIVDPQDLPSVLDALISQTINALGPVEVSFIKRRVKHSLRWIHKCVESGADDDGRTGTTSISGKVGRLVTSGFSIAATASSSSVHPNGGEKSLHGTNGSAVDRGVQYYTCHPSLDESTPASFKSSKATFQKDRLMDITVVRKVFEGGERTLRLMQASVRAETMADVGLGTNVANADGGGGGGMVVPKRRSMTKLTVESCHSSVGSNTNTGDIHLQAVKESDRDAIDKIDVYGSAFLLLSYLSESRWDYITEIAKLSAERASLITDVNDLALLEKEHTTTTKAVNKIDKRNEEPVRDDDSDSNKSVTNGLKMAAASRYGRKKIPYPPPSPSFVPPSQIYNLPDLVCNEPAGITLPSLCYIIALALRGSRRQKLNLLFYLLMPPKELDILLASHPAGGLPTWLLEVDGGLILTYDSLSYYYHYESVMAPLDVTEFGSAENGFSFGSTNQSECVRRRLAIDARMSVEILSALLVDSAVGSSWLSFGDEKNGWSDQGYSYGTRRLRSLVTAPVSDQDLNSSMLAKCEGIHQSLHAAVEGNAFSIPTAQELESLEQFLECTAETSKISPLNSSSSSARTLWSMKDFVKWADVSLNDSLLNNVMHRLFGCGILPCAKIERNVVSRRWVEWNLKDFDNSTSSSKLSVVNSPARVGFRSMFTAQKSDQENEEKLMTVSNAQNRVWGGIGGFDGKGGLGHGVLYCIDKHWWDDWVAYTGWQFGKCAHDNPISLQRPRELSTERLIERSADSPFVAGTRGSYEPMRSGVSIGEDYVLVPPGVWNVLYDLYGGGPPLPRMVLPNTSTSSHDENNDKVKSGGLDPIEYEYGGTLSNLSVHASRRENFPIEIPRSVRVATHPWIVHCQICDPQQPYRRGDAGPMSIRIMTMPEQPLWRLFSEVILRLPISHPKSKDTHGEGRARLWRFEASDKTPNTLSRYGPWALLCKNRFAEIPINTRQFEKYEDSWKAYADQHSVESVGLLDGMRIMFEYAVVNKDGTFSWPREAAAKATRLRRIADEDVAFRLILRGLDNEGKPLRAPILKLLVDVMDSSGRWYQAVIVNADKTARPPDSRELTDDNEHSETASDEADSESAEFRENTFVRVHYSDYAGNNHEEWIDVKSDRLAVGGRFTASVPSLEDDIGADESTANEPKSRLSGPSKKKDSNDSTQNESITAMCLFPSYGACGLVNLGNTCYANSGWQCMSYLPLLRAYLLSGQYKVYGDLNRDNPLGTGGRLLEEFAELMHVMWSGKFGSRAPNKFRNFLGKCRPQYSGADQQDAQELINDMIDMLHEDGNRVKKKPFVAALEDNFIEKTELGRVGQESWRRFLRRNRSAISDLAMGQVYNRVTCPVCRHSSKNFDPFNMLSLPFPTVAEVIFQCTVVRRANNLNCPRTLLMVHRQQQANETNGKAVLPSPPSRDLIFEEYIIPMSRLADIGDLKMKLQNVTGIASSRFRICKKEEIVTGMGKDEPFAAQVYHKVSALPDKEGPCVKLLHQVSLDDISSPMIAKIIAFESTLNPRPLSKEGHDSKVDKDDDASTVGEMSDDSSSEPSPSGGDQNKILEHNVHECLKYYGDEKECIIFDTNPTPLSKYVSRCLWPKSAQDFTLGLRVDAIDHRNNWFPGSVIEIIEGQDISTNVKNNGSDLILQPRVKVHFDNFSSKWDEIYSIESFSSGRVCPLYSHATPRSKATEFLVHHRAMDRRSKQFYLFGQSFYLQCHNEWSTARAGAHILAQASRFLECPHFSINTTDTNVNLVDQKIAEKRRHETRKVIASIIDALLTNDREYIQSAIESGKEAHTPFNASTMSKALIKNLNEVLPLLPFDIRVTTADSPLGSNKEEAAFPFSLARTIGNYMNARHSLVLHWRETPDHISSSKLLHNKHVGRFCHILYAPPPSAAHESVSLLSANSNSISKSSIGNPSLRRHTSSSHGGMHIGVCLAEFCKEQRLDAADSWRCPVCKVEREGRQSMSLWNLPDLLTFHLKRFNASSRWREKITTKVDFPLTGLNMREWCDNESPMCQNSDDDISFIYDLIGVVNHYGGMTGGHYVAMCKATACSSDGVEDVAYSFNGSGTADFETIEGEVIQSGWRLGRSKDKDYSPNAASKAVAESAEPLWLQFDDDLVEPLPPRNVVSETAYVLFYRRRRMQASNVAKYSVLE